MKTSNLLLAALLAAGFCEPSFAQKVTQPAEPAPKKGPIPPPVYSGETPPPAPGVYVYEQKPAATARPYLVTPEQASQIIERFKAAYGRIGSPRMLIFVNRELIDAESDLQLTARSEQTETVRGSVDEKMRRELGSATQSSEKTTAQGDGGAKEEHVTRTESAPRYEELEKVTAKNTFRVRERRAPALADRQTVRDVERLFGRPLRMSGVRLADQRIASSMLAERTGRPLSMASGEAARQERQVLQQVADVVLEVLMTSRDVVVEEVSGPKTFSVPDLHVTAIRLSDAQILGQATAADLVGHGRRAGSVARQFDVREITEATALALMEDMMLALPEPIDAERADP